MEQRGRADGGVAEEVWPASSGLRRAGEEGKEGGTNEREARQVGFSIFYFFYQGNTITIADYDR